MTHVEDIFGEGNNSSINKLMSDKDDKDLIIGSVAGELEDYGGFLWRYPKDQVIALMMSADFANKEEALYVGNMVNYHMENVHDIIPQVTEHNGLSLASRCLVSLGLFRGYLQSRTDRRGAPSPSFYENVGISIFNKYGKENIAKNFKEWEEFLGLQFKLAQTGF